jgi:hypothetical protein
LKAYITSAEISVLQAIATGVGVAVGVGRAAAGALLGAEADDVALGSVAVADGDGVGMHPLSATSVAVPRTSGARNRLRVLGILHCRPTLPHPGSAHAER